MSQGNQASSALEDGLKLAVEEPGTESLTPSERQRRLNAIADVIEGRPEQFYETNRAARRAYLRASKKRSR